MRRLKLFPKVFLYTFFVMVFVTAMAHLLLFLFAPQVNFSYGNAFEQGVFFESEFHAEPFIKTAILRALPYSLAGCTLISLVCSLVFAGRITKPIRQISKAAKQMANLDRLAQCPVTSEDEIGMLAANINTLYGSLLATISDLEEEKERVREAEQSKIDFLRAASHELKTPVTALHAVMENMILGVGKYRDRERGLVKCQEMVVQLSRMIQEVLDTSKTDFEKEYQGMETFDLAELLRKVWEPYQLIAKAKRLRVQMEILEPCPRYTSRKGMSKILSNLFSNAVSYTKSGERILISLTAETLVVENECVPVSAEKLPHLFEPFYRPDFARDRKDGGNGLGLYIVAGLSKALRLSYTFEAVQEPKEMRFVLELHSASPRT